MSDTDRYVREAEHREGSNAYLFDAEHIDSREVFALFVKSPSSVVQTPFSGRGEIRIVEHAGHDYVLRHYHRGGKLAGLSKDRYVWHGFDASRPWREWRLLANLFQAGLPVPRPLAARLIRRGAISGATARTNCSTAPPTEAIALWPGRARRAGDPLTSTMAPSSARCSVPRRTQLVYPQSLSKLC